VHNSPDLIPVPFSFLQEAMYTRRPPQFISAVGDGPVKAAPVVSGRLLGLIPAVFIGELAAAREFAAGELKGDVTVGWPEASRACTHKCCKGPSRGGTLTIVPFDC
jgi:hypothetical protein